MESVSTGRRLTSGANQMIVSGYAVKTLESKETRASKEIRITHNSVFAAHRLQCRMTIHKVDIRHFAFRAESRRSIDATLRLLLQPRNVPRSKLPAAIAFHQSIRELHDTVELEHFRLSRRLRYRESTR